MWSWVSDSFGDTEPNEAPDGDGQSFTLNLRFPGQYFDAEIGKSYNWHRYYDSSSGRYDASDPIGLGGGLNLYEYAASDPLSRIDPDGRVPIIIPAIITITGGLAIYGGYEFFNLACEKAEKQKERDERFERFLDGEYDIDIEADQNERYRDLIELSEEANDFSGDMSRFNTARDVRRGFEATKNIRRNTNNPGSGAD